jgi:hypothetical protein
MSTPLGTGSFQIDLHHHESIGGHTIGRHVAQSDAGLRQRLINNPMRLTVSTFDDVATAQQAVNQVILANNAAILAWLGAGGMPPLIATFDHDMGRPIGWGFTRLPNGGSPGPTHSRRRGLSFGEFLLESISSLF